jgi:signal transduction histidine kinase
MPNEVTRRRAYWTSQGVCWTVFAVLNMLLLNSYYPMDFRGRFTVTFFAVWGIVITHGLRWWVRRRGLVSMRWSRMILEGLYLVPFGGAFLTAGIFLNWKLWMGGWISTPGVSPLAIAVSTSFNMSFLTLLWLAIYVVVHLFWKMMTLREGQLLALQAQVNPHFLFNSLNSLRGLILENPAAAQDAVTRLSQLMRYSLQQTKRELVPLDEELDAVRDYLAIEAMRFEQRLRVRWEMEEGLEQVMVPPMSLQTLVENALKHGIAKLPEGGEVGVSARRQGTDVVLSVRNPGRIARHGEGTGLANLRQRLSLLRGGAARMDLREKDGEVVAEVVLVA